MLYYATICSNYSNTRMPVFSRFLQYFVAVAERGSMRRASEVLNITASAVDRQILLGERYLGIPLFERLPGGLRLTAAGALLFDQAKRWNKEFERVRVAFEDLRGLRRGHVRFAVIDALAKGFVPALIRQLQQRQPSITTEIAVLDNARVAEVIAAGEVEFGLMLNPLSSKLLSVRAYAEIPIGIVSKIDHPIATQASVRFSACADLPMVAPGPPLALCEQIAGLEAATGVPLHRIAVCDNIQMIKSLIGLGVGVSVLSWLDVADEIAQGELAFTPIANSPLRPLTLGLCTDPARQLSHAGSALLTLVATALTDLRHPA
jgi:DNA-binding transcriptional LysR family regulator